MKKRISLLLAVIMIISPLSQGVSAALPPAGEVELWSSLVSGNPISDKGLRATTNSPRPELYDVSRNSHTDTVLLGFPFYPGSNGRTYELWVNLADGNVGRLVVHRAVNNAVVEFQIESGAAGPAFNPYNNSQTAIAAMNSATLKNIGNYRFYEVSGSSYAYIPIETYMNNMSTATSSAVRVLPRRVADTGGTPFDYTQLGGSYGGNYWGSATGMPGEVPNNGTSTVYYPIFDIVAGEGASFEYGGYTVRFLWNGNDFLFSIDGYDKGIIQNAVLNCWNGNAVDYPNIPTADGPTTDKRDIFMGFHNSITVISYANGSTTAAALDSSPRNPNTFENSSGGPYGGYSVATVIDTTNGLPPGVGDPGESRADIELTFNLPMEWNFSGGGFNQSTGAILTSMHFRLQMVGTGNVDITHQNLLSVPVGTYIPVDSFSDWQGLPAGSRFVPAIRRNADDTISLMIYNLPPSALYSNVSWVTDTPGLDTPGPTSPDTRNSPVYTFINYGINDTGDDYALWFIPYTSGQGYPGRYVLYESTLGGSTAAPPHPGGNPIASIAATGKESMLYFSLGYDASANTPLRYIIEFVPDGGLSGRIFSQYYRFQPSFKPPIGNVKNFNAEVVSLKPKSPTSDEEATLTARLRWDVGTAVNIEAYFREHLVQGNFDAASALFASYSLQYALTPDEALNTPFTSFASFECLMTLDSSSTTANMRINVTVTDTGSGNPSSASLIGNPYTTELIKDMGRYYVEVEVEIDAHRYGVDPAGVPEIIFYPEVYFLRIKPEVSWYTDAVTGAVVPGGSGGVYAWSEYDSITLSDIETAELPPPQNLRAHSPVVDANEVSFTLSWELSGEGIKRYLANRFTAAEIDEAYINIYITSSGLHEDNPYFRNTFANLPAASRALDPRIERSNSTLTSLGVTGLGAPDPDRVYFSEIGAAPPAPVVSTASFTMARDALRENANQSGSPDRNIVLMDKMSVPTTGSSYMVTVLNALPDRTVNPGTQTYSITIDGLDTNEKYYAYADFVIEGVTSGSSFKVESKLSNMTTITLEGDLDIPTGADKVPPAPDDFNNRNVTSYGAELYWSPVAVSSPVVSPGAIMYEYEIIRLMGAPLPPAALGSKDPFGVFYASVTNSYKLGMRTDSSGLPLNFALEIFDGGSFRAMTAEEAALHVPYYDAANNQFTFTDNDLYPNQVYYYYIRTVKTVYDASGNVESVMYSGFVGTTLTTSTIEAPENLREDPDADFDDKTEFVFKFDALCHPTLLGNTLNFQYQIREENGAWSDPILMDAGVLRASAAKTHPNAAPGTRDDGLWTYTYKLTGLNPSTRYEIRVRMIDSSGDASMYTDPLVFRTGMDNDEYDKKWQADSWARRLRELLEELLKDPYWITRNTAAHWQIVYRPGRFPAVVNSTKGAVIELPVTGAPRATYYIPASALAAANNGNKGFKVKLGDMEINIPALAVSHKYNDSVIAIEDAIKLGRGADWYYRLDVELVNYIDQINGSDPLTPEVIISMDIVGSSMLAETFDKELTDEFIAYIDALIDDPTLQARLLSNVDSSIPDTEFVKFIEALVDAAKTDFAVTANAKLSATVTAAAPIEYLDKTMTITANGIDRDASVSGYHFEGGAWRPLDVMPFGEGTALRTEQPGAYIFAGKVVSIPGVEEVKKGGNITGIAAKYGLDDFLGRDGVIDMNAPATREAVIGCIARMAGAPKGADPVKWLRDNMNINISTRNMNSQMTTEEAVFLVMSLYEAKSRTKISAVRIRNMNQTAGIQGISENYRQHIRAAFELGIYSNPGMKPKEGIIIKDLLEMFGNLDAKVKLR